MVSPLLHLRPLTLSHHLIGPSDYVAQLYAPRNLNPGKMLSIVNNLSDDEIWSLYRSTGSPSIRLHYLIFTVFTVIFGSQSGICHTSSATNHKAHLPVVGLCSSPLSFADSIAGTHARAACELDLNISVSKI